MPVTAESLRVQAELDADLKAVTDAQTRALVAAWATAWSEVSTDLQDTLVDLMSGTTRVTRAAMLRSVRLRRVLTTIGGRLTDLAADAGVTITADLADVVDQAAAAQTRIITTQLPTLVDAVDLLDEPLGDEDDEALAAIVRRSTEQVTSLTKALAPEAESAVRRELVRGVAVGSSPRDTARRMVARAEGRFNGGLTRAMTIARTETLDAHRAAAQVRQQRHTDVLTGWVWLAHLDARTCPACMVKNGTVHDIDQAGPEGHQNCRCARLPQTKSWADLGIDIPEPPSAVRDARAWFDALPEADQVAIMGRRRLELLRDGSISWDQLATLRRTPGWRDSWGVAPLSALTQASRVRAAS